jgi:hypothetical protein
VFDWGLGICLSIILFGTFDIGDSVALLLL